MNKFVKLKIKDFVEKVPGFEPNIEKGRVE